MRLLETQCWAMPVPDDWHIEVDEDTVVVADNEGVGSLEFSVLELEGAEPGREELLELAAELVPRQGGGGQPLRCGAWEGLRFEYVDGDDYCRDWLLAHEARVLLVSYTCALEHRELDDAAVDELLGELSAV